METKDFVLGYGAGKNSAVSEKIVEEVDAWLDEHITNPDSPPLDRSLTSSSAAAPADMVGEINDEVGDLRNTLTKSFDGIMPIGYCDTFVAGTLDSDGSANTSIGSWRIVNINLIEFDRDIILSVKSGYKMLLALFENNVHIRNTSWEYSFVIPAHQQFRLTIAEVTEDTSKPADISALGQAVTLDSKVGYNSMLGSVAYNDVSNIIAQYKNLMPIGFYNTGLRGLSVIYNNGIFEVSGTATGTDFAGGTVQLVKFSLPAGDYVLGLGADSVVSDIQWFVRKVSNDDVVVTGTALSPINRTFTLSEETQLYLSLAVSGGATYDCTIKLQIEKGSTTTAFISPITANDLYAREKITEYDPYLSSFSIVNRFDKNSADNIDGKYMPSQNMYDSATYTVSHYIDLDGLSKIMTSYIHMFSWFDADKIYLSHDNVSGYENADIPLTVPSGARYVRCSFKTEYKSKVQLGSHITRNDYTPYGYFRILKQTEVGSVTVVDKNGGGDYTSLLEAMISTTNDVIVRYGEYDLVAEYKAYFGNDYFTNPSAYVSVAGNFAHGLWISERKVIFEAGSRVIYDLTNIDVSYSEGNDRRFSAIMVGHNAKIIGLNCVGTHNWYVVHDDGGVRDYAYTNEFIDCHIVGANLVNENAIGAGCQTQSKTIIDGCYLDNGASGVNTKTIRYHNTPYAGKPQIIVKDTYVNGKMFFQYLGTQTEKGRVMVNNCSMGSAIELSALSDGQSENWELFAWNNETRS